MNSLISIGSQIRSISLASVPCSQINEYLAMKS